MAESMLVGIDGYNYADVPTVHVQAEDLSEEMDTQFVNHVEGSDVFLNELVHERCARELADTELRNLIEENQQTILRYVASLELETAALRTSVACAMDDRETSIAALTARYEDVERELQRELIGRDDCIRALDQRLATVEQRIRSSVGSPIRQQSDLQLRLDALEQQLGQMTQWPSFESFKVDARNGLPESLRSETAAQKLLEFDEEVARSLCGTPNAKSPGKWITNSPAVQRGVSAASSVAAPASKPQVVKSLQAAPQVVKSLQSVQNSRASIVQPSRIRIPSIGAVRTNSAVAPVLSARGVENRPFRSGSEASLVGLRGPHRALPACSLPSAVTTSLPTPVTTNFGPFIGPLPQQIVRQRSAPTTFVFSAATGRQRTASDSPSAVRSSGRVSPRAVNRNDGEDEYMKIPFIESLMPQSLQPQRRESGAQTPVTPIMTGLRNTTRNGPDA